MSKKKISGFDDALNDKFNRLIASGQIVNFSQRGGRYRFEEHCAGAAFTFPHDHDFREFKYVIGGMKVDAKDAGERQ